MQLTKTTNLQETEIYFYGYVYFNTFELSDRQKRFKPEELQNVSFAF